MFTYQRWKQTHASETQPLNVFPASLLTSCTQHQQAPLLVLAGKTHPYLMAQITAVYRYQVAHGHELMKLRNWLVFTSASYLHCLLMTLANKSTSSMTLTGAPSGHPRSEHHHHDDQMPAEVTSELIYDP